MKPSLRTSSLVFTSARLGIAAALALGGLQARAADGTWIIAPTGTGAVNWSSAALWSGGILADGADFTANFTGVNIAAAKTVTLDSSRSIGNITFTDATTASHNLTISGANSLTLDVGTGSPLINVTNQTLVISSVVAGADGLTKTGAGALTLGGANTLTGPVIINGGILNIANYSALGGTNPGTDAPSSITVSGGASLNLQQVGTGSTTDTNYPNLSLDGNLRTTGGSATNQLILTWAGNVTLTGNSLVHANGNSAIRISGQIDLGSNTLTYQTDGTIASNIITGGIIGTGGLTKTGGNTLFLNSATTYTGTTTINAGVLSLGNVNALQNTSGITMTGGTLRPSSSLTLNAPITTSGTVVIGAPSNNPGSQAWNELFLNGAIGGIGNVTFASNVNSNSISTVTLNAPATYSGTTLLDTNGGSTATQIVVRLGVENALPTTTVVTIDGQNGAGTGRGAEINMNGFSQTLAGLTNVTRSLRSQRVVNPDNSAPATLTINGSSDTTFAGNLGSNSPGFSLNAAASNATNGNNFGLTKNGTGTFTLSAANTFTGPTRIQGGILNVGHASALGQSPLDTLNSAIGDATNGLSTALSSLTLGGLTGDKNLASLFTPTGGYAGLITLTLNPISGASHAYSGTIADGDVMSLVKTGAGTQSLSGANAYSGSTTVSAGTLRLDFSAPSAVASNIVSTNSLLTLNGGSLALQGKASTSNSQQFNGLSLTGGVSSSIQVIADPAANPLLLSLGAITRSGGATVDFTLPAGTQNASNGITTATPNAAGSNILGGWATIGGTAWASNNGTNIVPLTTYTATSVAGVTAANYFGNDMDVDGSAGLLGGPIAASSLRFNTAAATTVTLAAGVNVINSGGILVNSTVGNNPSIITGGTLMGSPGGELAVLHNNPANSLHISSAIADNGGPTALVKSGPGTLILSGINSYSGGTTLAGGTLRFASIASMPAAGAVSVGAGATLAVNAGGVGEFTGDVSGNGSLGGLLAGLGGQPGGTVAYAGAVKLGVDTANAGGSLAYTDAIPNVGSSLGINKLGAGILSLTGTNTYSGGTIISEGTLHIGGAGKLADAGTISIAGGATLHYGSTAAQTFSGAITGAGSLVKDTGSTTQLTLTSTSNTFSGGITVSAGRVGAGAASPLSTGTITCVGNSLEGGQLFLTGTPTITNNLVISGVGYPDAVTTPNTGRAGAVRMSTGQTFTGTITLAGDSRIGVIAGSTSNTLTGRITGGFGLDLYGGLNGNSATHTFILANTGAANDHTGDTSISSLDFNGVRTGGKAVLQLGAGNQIPNGVGKGNLVFNGADADHVAILELNGFSETLNGVSSVSAAGAIIRNTAAGASTLTIGDANVSSTFSGVITDGGAGNSLAIIKIGSGTITLTGANSYTGDTTVNGGTLSVSSPGFADTSTVSVATGAVLNLDYVGTEAVGSLVLNGVVQPGGTYDSANSGGFITGTGALSVPMTGPTLAAFNTANFNAEELGDALVSGPTADPDRDGIPNVLEFAFATNPRVSGRVHLPVANTVLDSGSTYVGCVYTRVKGASELTFTPQFASSPESSAFSSSGATTLGIVDNGNGTETVTLRDNTAVGAGTKRFVRILVTYP